MAIPKACGVRSQLLVVYKTRELYLAHQQSMGEDWVIETSAGPRAIGIKKFNLAHTLFRELKQLILDYADLNRPDWALNHYAIMLKEMKLYLGEPVWCALDPIEFWVQNGRWNIALKASKLLVATLLEWGPINKLVMAEACRLLLRCALAIHDSEGFDLWQRAQP